MAMWTASNGASSHTPDMRRLLLIFSAWKLLLFIGAVFSPGPGYDTSTQLLLPSASESDLFPIRLLANVLPKFVRWDALYFVNSAHRGYLYEQEWAFHGSGFTTPVGGVAKVFSTFLPPLYAEATAGILIAHISNLLSTFILYILVAQIVPSEQPWRKRAAFAAACLYIFSPAGMFLSAPYGESLFASLNFLGVLLCAIAWTPTSPPRSVTQETLLIIAAGACFGLSSTVRGNGMLSVLVFVEPGLMALHRLTTNLREDRAPKEIVAIGLAVLLTAAGTLGPQIAAYKEYCTSTDPRPWCSNLPPSIYAFVQDHYWNVGFLRYWTLSNLPLFLLAIPMLIVLMITGYVAVLKPLALLVSSPNPRGDNRGTVAFTSEVDLREKTAFARCVRRFALPQIVLAVLTLMNFHVQIINRISSGYPMWYLVIALAIVTERNETKSTGSSSRSRLALSDALMIRLLGSVKIQEWLVRSMIMYAMIQGGLYASFMPPA